MAVLKNLKVSEAKKYAELLAKKIKGGEVLALEGPLGSGKTTFTQHLAKALKSKQKVTSPTFTLLQPIRILFPQKRIGILYHLDLYRIKDFNDAKQLGLTEFWGQPNTLTVIEWADKIKKHLPKKTLTIRFK